MILREIIEVISSFIILIKLGIFLQISKIFPKGSHSNSSIMEFY